MSSPVSLPMEIVLSAQRGELQKVVKWLRKGGLADALWSSPHEGQSSAFTLLQIAGGNGHLAMVRELLKRGASVDLPNGLGLTALMAAARHGHLSILLVLLQHSADPDCSSKGTTALMMAAGGGQESCVKALLRAKANTELLDDGGRTALQWALDEGHGTTAALIRQHAAPPQTATASPAAPQDAGEPAESSAASLPNKIHQSAERGELQRVVKWLRKGGLVDALCSAPDRGGRAETLLRAAAICGQLEVVREVLKQGASVDLQTENGSTALMSAAYKGYLSIVRILLQHSANPDLQSNKGGTALMQDLESRTALMLATHQGQEACVKALLRAKANADLVDNDGDTALRCAESKGYTAIAELIRQHAAPPQPAPASPATPPDADEPEVSSPASLPLEIHRSAQRGELQTVVKWLRKGGLADALCPTTSADGQATAETLLHAATANSHLEMVRELLKRGASIDLSTSLDLTALMSAAGYGRLSIVLVLLQHSANPDLQHSDGGTALMSAAARGHEACVKALLRAKANTELLDKDDHSALQWAERQGHTNTAQLIQQYAAPPQQPATASPATSLGAGEPGVSSLASLPLEVLKSAERGELQTVVKWLSKGGLTDALCPTTTRDGDLSTTVALLHAAAAHDHPEMVRELLKRGASVDLPSGLGYTALMNAAHNGNLSVLLLLLQHSASLDSQSIDGATALMLAAWDGEEACVQALLRAKANTELFDKDGDTALQSAENHGHKAIAELIRQHVQAAQAARAARADAAMEELLAEEAAEQAKGQARSKKSKKKKKAGRAAAAGDEPSDAPPAAAPAPPPAATPKPAASAKEQAEAALRAAIAGGELFALEVALAAAPCEVREGGVGEAARVRRVRLLEAQQEAEREAKQEAAAEAARLAAAERVWEVAARAAAASKAREEAVAAVAKADALERAMAGGEGDSSGAAGPSGASEAMEVPDDYVCPITAEIMTDPVSTADGFTYERAAITEWLRTKDTSPFTGAKLESKVLIPNLMARSLLRAFNEAGAAL